MHWAFLAVAVSVLAIVTASAAAYVLPRLANAPDKEPTIKMTVTALTLSALELLGKP